MNPAARWLSLLALLFGVGLYLLGVSGALWPASPPGDVGLVATSTVFALFGLLGLLLSRGERPAEGAMVRPPNPPGPNL